MHIQDQFAEHERDLQRLRILRPMDDDFMRCIFRDNILLTQHVLRVFTEIPDLQITSVETQKDFRRLVGARSICLDAYGIDSAGGKYDLEVQRSDEGADVMRARYHSSVLDIENLDAGQDFSELPETYVIFVTENDVFHQGLPIYCIERVNIQSDKMFGDLQHIIYVNGSYRGDDEIGRLMHDFNCSDPEEMYNQDLREISRYYKKTQEGVAKVCKIMEDMKNEVAVKTYIETCLEFGINDKVTILTKLLQKFKNLSESEAEMYLAKYALS